MITTLSGNNSYLLQVRLSQLVKGFIAEHGELAVEKIEAENVDAEAIAEAVSSSPFLTRKKLIIVKNLSDNKRAVEQIEQLISSINDSNDVILYEPTTDKRTLFYKTLKSKTDFEIFDDQTPQHLAKWLSGEATKQGGSLSLSDAIYLIDRVGQNQMLLHGELSKMLTYNPSVDRKIIDLLTERAPQGKMFDLLDAAFSGNKGRALQLYEQQRAQRVEPQEILAMLAWQLRVITAVVVGKEKSPSQIASDLGVGSFPVTKARQLASRLKLKDLQVLIEEATQIDRRSKTTSINIDEALRNYITTI